LEKQKIKFIFDLDGTITKIEALPFIAKHFNLQDQIFDLTKETIKGNVPFVESFIKRVNILGQINVDEINDILQKIPLFDDVLKFIQSNLDDCIVATGNLDVWSENLLKRIGCESYVSQAKLVNKRVVGIKSILKKSEIVSDLKRKGFMVVYVGDGNNDAEAMRLADISIACGCVHNPANSVMAITDYVIYEEKALIRILKAISISIAPPGQSLVISCAGIGSRLGLNSTKALIEFNGRPLIQWQLENFWEIQDIKIVVGFEANQVIKAVREIRNDVIFVFNHDYFSTATGKSLFLGARYSNEFIIAWDGDLVVHYEDIIKCLSINDEYLGISNAISEDTIFAILDDEEQKVIDISRSTNSKYEWSGPARLKKERILDQNDNVFKGLLNQLPLPALKIRAFDIDTSSDYNFAKENFDYYHNNSRI